MELMLQLGRLATGKIINKMYQSYKGYGRSNDDDDA